MTLFGDAVHPGTIFLPRVPLMKPRTLCACQDVASIISASVAPLARWIKARTVAVLLPSLTPPAFGFAAFLGALAACLAEVAFLGLAAAAALGLPPLALFWPLGAPFLGLAPFFGEAFSGATFAPCAATSAARCRCWCWWFLRFGWSFSFNLLLR